MGIKGNILSKLSNYFFGSDASSTDNTDVGLCLNLSQKEIINKLSISYGELIISQNIQRIKTDTRHCFQLIKVVGTFRMYPL